MVLIKKKKSVAIPSALAGRIPYQTCFEDEGMILAAGSYTKMYLVDDIKPANVQNFDQAVAQQRMENLLNSFPVDVSFQFLIHNKLVDEETYLSKVLLDPKYQDEELKEYTEQYDRVLADNFAIGHNNVHKTLYFILSVKADIPDDAVQIFRQLDTPVREAFNSMYGITIKGLTLTARLKVMYTIFNPEKGGFGQKIMLEGEGDKLDLGNLKYMKLTTKDLVAPSNWNSSVKLVDHTILNDGTDKVQYTRSFYINSIPKDISASFISDLTNISSNMLFSAVYEPIDSKAGFDAASEVVKNNTTITKKAKRDTVTDRKNKTVIQVEELKKWDESAYFSRAALETFKDAVAQSSKTFNCSFVITLYAENLDVLDSDTELLHISGAKFGASINCLDMQQTQGFQSCLPLGHSFIDAARILDIRRLATMSPIGVQDAAKKGGLYCGLNAINDTLILLNRKNNTVLSGMIAGTEHSGKSYQMKREIFNAAISTKDTINIISTTDEYKTFAEKIGGEVIEFGVPNLFNMEKGYGLLDDDHKVKAGFYDALFTALQNFSKSHTEDEAEQLGEKVEDEVVRLSSYLKENPDLDSEGIVSWIDDNKNDLPYIVDGLNKLQGNYNDVLPDAKKRIVVYRAHNSAEILMLMDYLWNKTITDKRQGKNNWIFIDSADDVLKLIQGADYFTKYLTSTSQLQTIMTFVIQDSVRLVNSPSYVVSLENAVGACGYIKLLDQGPIERKKYEDILGIPGALLPYISNVEPGKGLIISSATNLAFNDNFNELYSESSFKDLFHEAVEQIRF